MNENLVQVLFSSHIMQQHDAASVKFPITWTTWVNRHIVRLCMVSFILCGLLGGQRLFAANAAIPSLLVQGEETALAYHGFRLPLYRLDADMAPHFMLTGVTHGGQLVNWTNRKQFRTIKTVPGSLVAVPR